MKKNSLQQALSKRHILFMAFGSAIGTGLFYGSGQAIAATGPSVLLAYMISGFIAFLIMRALGEMLLQHKKTGSFGHYAKIYISPLAGFLTGWTYVFEMILVCLADITAFATYMGFWYPEISPWVWTLCITAAIGGLNLCAVKIYGEVEFFFSLFKVLAIVLMMVGGLYLLVSRGLSQELQLETIKHVLHYKFWFAHGQLGFISALIFTLFSFGGIEIVGLTIGEAQNPEKTLPSAINAIPARIVFFYIMTIGLLMLLYPWNKLGTEGSPFVLLCHYLHIAKAANLLNCVVIAAAISAINSDVYGASRMLYGLAEDGYAFKGLRKISKTGTPFVAILLVTAILLVGVVLNYFFHKHLFFLIAAMATFATLFVWLMILMAQFCMRLRFIKSQKSALSYPMPLWPLSNILSFSFMVFILCALGFSKETRVTVALGIVWLAALVGAFYLQQKASQLRRNVRMQKKMVGPEGLEPPTKRL